MKHIWADAQKRNKAFWAEEGVKSREERKYTAGTGRGGLDQWCVPGRHGQGWRCPFAPSLASPPVTPSQFSLSTSCWRLWRLAVKAMGFICLRGFPGTPEHGIIWGQLPPPLTRAWDFGVQVLNSILTPVYGKSFGFSCFILLSCEKFDISCSTPNLFWNKHHFEGEIGNISQSYAFLCHSLSHKSISRRVIFQQEQRNGV